METVQETEVNTNSNFKSNTQEKLDTNLNKLKKGDNNDNNISTKNEKLSSSIAGDLTDLYEMETVSGNYIVSVSLKNDIISKSKKYNLIKIYRFIASEGINPVSIKMTGFSRAEMITRNRDNANKLLRKGTSEGSCMYTSIPYRTKYRKGVITEWEGSIEELREQLSSKTILIKFQGDSLPTKLLIGYGHVWIKVEPFVESVKQCYKCLRFGHTQTKCRNQKKRCFVCSKEYHGTCNERPKCHNCGEEHTSMARECRINQRERFIKKIMAYKNVPYKVAKERASLCSTYETNQVGDKPLQYQYDIHGRREENENGLRQQQYNDYNHGNTKFPSLCDKNRVEYWKSITGPIETDISNFKKAREVTNHRTPSTRQPENYKQISGPRITKDSWTDVVSKQFLEKSTHSDINRRNTNDNTRKFSRKGRAEERRWLSGTSNRFEILNNENEKITYQQGDSDPKYNRKKSDTSNRKTNYVTKENSGKRVVLAKTMVLQDHSGILQPLSNTAHS